MDPINKELEEQALSLNLDDLASSTTFEIGKFEDPITPTPAPSPAPAPATPPVEGAPPPSSTPPPAQAPTLTEIDKLINDIDSASLEGDKSPASIGSFNGLKTRYKTAIEPLRQKVAQFEAETTALRAQLEEAKKHEEASVKLAEAQTKLSALETDLLNKTKENESLLYYRRKYDAEADPEIKRSFIEPLNELKRRSMDIIEDAGLDETFWAELMGAESEAKLNRLIDSSNITGLNAQSLRQYATKYSIIDRDYREVMAPENIEISIAQARGRSLQNADKLAKDTFEKIKLTFAEHCQELREHPENKEHNIFVYDKAIEDATRNYAALRKALPADFHNPYILGSLAQSAFMSAAYPMQKKFAEHLINKYNALLSELRSEKPPGVRHRKEANGHAPGSFTPEDVKKAASTSIEEIANETASTLFNSFRS